MNWRSIRVLLVASVLAPCLALVAGVAPAAAVSPDVVVSQVYGGGGNSGATLQNDFIELHNRSAAPVSLTGFSVQYASATGSSWQVTPLAGTIAPGGYYLVQEAAGLGGTTPLPTPDATGTIAMSATAGKVALVTTTTLLTCGTGCTADATVRDLVGYGATASSFEGAAPAPGLSNTTAALRADDGAVDTDDNAADFTAGPPNPRNSGFEPPPPPPSGCDVPATHEIAEVQGSGASTPVAGQSVRVEGVVTGDFQGATGLGGFFLQDATPDADPATSDGVFVASETAVAAGDLALVTGTAAESFGLTALSPVTVVDVCGTGTVAAEPYDLPRPVGVTFEPVEGVLVTFPEALAATEHFQLGRFGEVAVSADGRLFQPTDRLAPGPDAQALADLNARRRLLLDDGSNVQNPATVPYLTPEAVRIGDEATGVTGVLSFGFGSYRLEPTAPITFARTNPRPAAPAPVGGDVRVASFNTLNYFTTLADDNPNARGANDADEFARQQAKEVAAILGLDADVLGLMEVENNGPTAVGSLVDALNAATAPGTYAAITEPELNPPNEFGGTFGTDAIKVALIYRPAVVTPLGPAQTSADGVFDRPPLIQTFEPTGGGDAVTVVVNHFKSKNCGGATGADLDQGDGQSCFNARRVAQAEALVATLAGLDVPNPLIVGDLNSYTEEDPVHVLEEAGYVGVSETFIDDDDRYSFVFDGLSGELDHALAGPDLADDVTGATIWHSNADEPLILDYNTEFNPPGLYQPDAYRASDHDPLVIGLQLTEPATVPDAPTVMVVAGWGAATVDWEEPGDGGAAITGYEVRALESGVEVASATVGPDVRSHTFGQLTSGLPHTFEVVAINEVGAGPAGSVSATPFVPSHPLRLRAGVSCPAFTATNDNPYPVSVSWTIQHGARGDAVVPAASTVTLDAAAVPHGRTKLTLSADGRQQDQVTARC